MVQGTFFYSQGGALLHLGSSANPLGIWRTCWQLSGAADLICRA